MATKTRKTGEPASAGDSPGDVLAEPTAQDLTSALPESLTIDVTLPEQVRSAPEEELAIAIGDSPVRAGRILEQVDGTTSISLIPVTVLSRWSWGWTPSR